VRGFLLGLMVGAVAGVAGAWVVLERRGGAEPLVAGLEIDPAELDPGDGELPPKRRTKARRRGALNESGSPQLNAADREMTWRGQPVALPDRDVDFGEGVAGRPLGQSEINAGIGGRRRELTDCILEARGEAVLTARMTLKFLVDGNGAVSRTRVRAPAYLQRRGLYDCADRVVRCASRRPALRRSSPCPSSCRCSSFPSRKSARASRDGRESTVESQELGPSNPAAFATLDSRLLTLDPRRSRVSGRNQISARRPPDRPRR
jgi:hypothetical protein